ncbi:MAG: 7TM domain-containing protein [Parcubacteria group bacterium]
MHISPIILFFIQKGLPFETVILLLMLPIIATFIALLRQVVGVKAFGIYTPLIVTFAFLATNGLKYGITIFISVIVTGMLMRFILKPFRLLYLPRVAIMLTAVAILTLGVLTLGGDLHRTGLAAVSIFPILIMITIVEKFVAVQIEKGTRVAILLATETLFISIIGFFIASSETLIRLIASAPWLILITVPINVAIGKWTGLRLSEYLRFKEIIKHL